MAATPKPMREKIKKTVTESRKIESGKRALGKSPPDKKMNAKSEMKYFAPTIKSKRDKTLIKGSH